MRQLENLAGCQLLSRSSRGVVPTATGLEFCRRTKEMLKMLEGLSGIGKEQAPLPSGHVVIGTAASVAAMVAVPLVNAARERTLGSRWSCWRARVRMSASCCCAGVWTSRS